MSVNKESTVERLKNNKKLVIKLVLCAIAIVAISVASTVAIMNKSGKDSKKDNKSSSGNAVEEGGKILTYELSSKKATKLEDLKTYKKILSSYTKNIKDGSVYTQVKTKEATSKDENDGYIYYLYNKNKEIFSQDSEAKTMELYLNNGQVIHEDLTTGEATEGLGIDLVTFLENGINALGKVDGTALYDMKIDKKSGDADFVDWRIDLVGEKAVEALYTSISDSFAKQMVKDISNSITSNSKVKKWEPHVILVFNLNNKEPKQSVVYCLFVIENTEVLNWTLQGYEDFGDWYFGDALYSFDTEKGDSEEFSKILNGVILQIQERMKEFAEKHGWTEETTSDEDSDKDKSSDKSSDKDKSSKDKDKSSKETDKSSDKKDKSSDKKDKEN